MKTTSNTKESAPKKVKAFARALKRNLAEKFGVSEDCVTLSTDMNPDNTVSVNCRIIR